MDSPSGYVSDTSAYCDLKRRTIEALRRDRIRERKHEEIARMLDETFEDAGKAIKAARDDNLGDELLCFFTSLRPANPILSADAREARIIRVVSGLAPQRMLLTIGRLQEHTLPAPC